MRLILAGLAGLLLSTGASAADICYVESPNGYNVTVDCQVSPDLWENSYRGYSEFGTPCQSGLCLVEPNRREGSAFYFWSISASETDPTVNTGPLPLGLVHLYLWLECGGEGMAAAEFSIEVDSPQLVYLALTMRNGCLNAGTLNDPLIAVGGCPIGPFLVGDMLLINTGTVSVESESWSGLKAMYR